MYVLLTSMDMDMDMDMSIQETDRHSTIHTYLPVPDYLYCTDCLEKSSDNLLNI